MKICVLGAGTWGTALARLLVLNGHEVVLWSKIPEELDSIETTRRHPNLPEMEIPSGLQYASDAQVAVSDADMVLFAVPSIYVRATAEEFAPFIPEDAILIDVAKGIESATLLSLSDVILDVLRQRRPKMTWSIVALSGPTHAEEVARDLPSTIVSASVDRHAAEAVRDAFRNDHFRVYTNEDIRGVELCGAMKNIVALAAGISDGLGFGDNAKAALMTRGMAEIQRLGLALGCQPETFAGLAGFGDLIVTATSVHSRNHRCGVYIGEGLSVADAIARVGQVVEGMNALPAAKALAAKTGVEMPIVDAVDAVLQGQDVRETVIQLMQREPKHEGQRFRRDVMK
ncbi:MAG: NAD(P)-dependent glycerol-3-phosphate dehydrogenase [Peptoniphilaceae bacterium]|nr:NAD(P)-dependent glycerol-3-phosphate dehydrogenase [Peptoniphilaceae bacterium]MDY6085250.1 NAD(P)H-dependent glycerol-3-phosphate dehydrogenase [Peptoniphilaceae bacterium]